MYDVFVRSAHTGVIKIIKIKNGDITTTLWMYSRCEDREGEPEVCPLVGALPNYHANVKHDNKTWSNNKDTPRNTHTDRDKAIPSTKTRTNLV